MYHFPAEAELIHSTGVEVFYENISFFNKAGKDFFAVGGGGVECEGFFIRVELEEVVAWFVGIELEFFSGCVAYTGAFNFDYVGTEPG